MAKKFENISARQEHKKITEQELDELAKKLSAEIRIEIDRARTKDKKNFGYNFIKILNRNDISLSLGPQLFKKIKRIIKEKNVPEDIDWRINSSYRHQLREEKRAGQSYFESDL